MNNLFAIHADLGAAKNIIKNVLLLNDKLYWPLTPVTDKLEFMAKHIYPSNWKYWFTHEYRLKTYESVGIKMQAGDVTETGLIPLSNKLERILNTHNYALDVFDHSLAVKLNQTSYSKVLCIFPTTDLGLAWQVRAYTLKKTPSQMHNYTCSNTDDIETIKSIFGIDHWIIKNLINFYDNCERNIQEWSKDRIPMIPLESIIFSDQWDSLLNNLRDYFQIDIDKTQSKKLLDLWLKLHWETKDTFNWEYSNIFPSYRTNKEIEILNSYVSH